MLAYLSVLTLHRDRNCLNGYFLVILLVFFFSWLFSMATLAYNNYFIRNESGSSYCIFQDLPGINIENGSERDQAGVIGNNLREK